MSPTSASWTGGSSELSSSREVAYAARTAERIETVTTSLPEGSSPEVGADPCQMPGCAQNNREGAHDALVRLGHLSHDYLPPDISPAPPRKPISLSTREDSEPVMIALPVALLRYLFEGFGDIVTLDYQDVERLREGEGRFEIFTERLQDPAMLRFRFRIKDE